MLLKITRNTQKRISFKWKKVFITFFIKCYEEIKFIQKLPKLYWSLFNIFQQIINSILDRFNRIVDINHYM